MNSLQLNNHLRNVEGINMRLDNSSFLNFSSSFYDSVQRSSERILSLKFEQIKRSDSAPKYLSEEETKENYPHQHIFDCTLPTICSIGRIATISVSTFFEVKNNNVILIDCRYPYEYEAGHVKNSINLWNENQLFRYVKHYSEAAKKVNFIVLFYCEFSQTRAPNLARQMRKFDYSINQGYCFKDIYLIKGGFNEIYFNCESLTTGKYVPMNDEEHFEDLMKYSRMCSDFKKRGKMGCLSFA